MSLQFQTASKKFCADLTPPPDIYCIPGTSVLGYGRDYITTPMRLQPRQPLQTQEHSASCWPPPPPCATPTVDINASALIRGGQPYGAPCRQKACVCTYAVVTDPEGSTSLLNKLASQHGTIISSSPAVLPKIIKKHGVWVGGLISLQISHRNHSSRQ